MIIQGDCLQELKRLDNNSVDLIVMDPPYSSKTSTKGVFGDQMWFTGDCMSERVFVNFITPVFQQLWSKLKTGSHIYCFVNDTMLRTMMDALEVAGFNFCRLLVWDKKNYALGSNKSWSPQTEYILFFSKSAPRGLTNGKRGCIIEHRPKKKQNHPSEKPLEVIKLLVEEGSREGEVVLDPFAGSGTTLLAAKQLGREYIGIEMSKEYCELIEERLKAVD